MKVVAVGGAWGETSGRPSSLFDRFVLGLRSVFPNTTVHNGGVLPNLFSLTDTGFGAGSLNEVPDLCVWMPDIPNNVPKLVEDFKKRFPKMLLVGSKRLDGRTIGLPEVVDRMLQLKMNLCLVLDRADGKFTGMVLDPLGNAFSQEGETDFEKLGFETASRAQYIHGVRRVGSESLGPVPKDLDPQCDPRFYEIVQKYAAQFDALVPRPKKVSRFLGNAAFRCSHGFPAFRGSQQGVIYVSRRNVDKSGIGPDGFVPVLPYRPYDTKVRYYGDHKPSVDTPINLLLFDLCPDVNYLVHGHVYAKNGVYTKRVVPCGAVEEFEAIQEVLEDRPSLPWFEVNLLGHGCIIGGRSVEDLQALGPNFKARPTLERTPHASASDR